MESITSDLRLFAFIRGKIFNYSDWISPGLIALSAELKKFLAQPSGSVTFGLVFLKNFIAVFLALVIANPACCCAFIPESSLSKASSTSCCQGDPGEPNEDDEKSCSCSWAKEKSAPEANLVVADTNGSKILPTPLPAEKSALIPNLPEAVSFLRKWPPGRLPVPTHGSRLAARCAYLI